MKDLIAKKLDETLLSELAPTIAAAGIRSTIDFEVKLLHLTDQQGALWVALRSAEDGLVTARLRSLSRCANLSTTAAAINLKLGAAGDDRRISCVMSSVAGQRGVVGIWRIEGAPLDDQKIARAIHVDDQKIARAIHAGGEMQVVRDDRGQCSTSLTESLSILSDRLYGIEMQLERIAMSLEDKQ